MTEIPMERSINHLIDWWSWCQLSNESDLTVRKVSSQIALSWISDTAPSNWTRQRRSSQLDKKFCNQQSPKLNKDNTLVRLEGSCMIPLPRMTSGGCVPMPSLHRIVNARHFQNIDYHRRSVVICDVWWSRSEGRWSLDVVAGIYTMLNVQLYQYTTHTERTPSYNSQCITLTTSSLRYIYASISAK